MVNNAIYLERSHRYMNILEEADALELQLRDSSLTPAILDSLQAVLKMKLLSLAGLAKEGVIDSSDFREVGGGDQNLLEVNLDGRNFRFKADEAKNILANPNSSASIEFPETYSQIQAPVEESIDNDSHGFAVQPQPTDTTVTSFEELEDIPDNEDNASEFEDTEYESSDLFELALKEKDMVYDLNEITVTKQISKKKTEEIHFKIMVAPLDIDVRSVKEAPIAVFAECTDTKEYTYDISSDGDAVEIDLAGCQFAVSGKFQRGEFSSVLKTEENGQVQVRQSRAKDPSNGGHVILSGEDITVEVFPVDPETNDYVAYLHDEDGGEDWFSSRDPHTFEIYGEEYTVDAGWDSRGEFTATLVTGDDADYVLDAAEVEEIIDLDANAANSMDAAAEKKEKPMIESTGFQVLMNIVVVSGLAIAFVFAKTNGLF